MAVLLKVFHDAHGLRKFHPWFVRPITGGQRLETYVITGPRGSGQIVVNGAAAHLINTGHRVTIMAWGVSESPVTPKRLLLNEKNEIVNETVK